MFAFFYNSWNRSFGGGSSGGGTDFSGGGQEQKPINPSSYSVCPLWEGEGGDAGKKQQAIADTINSTYSPRTGQIAPNPQLTYRETVKSFEKAGWTSFINVNPEHWGGADFEKYIDGAWFHLTADFR